MEETMMMRKRQVGGSNTNNNIPAFGDWDYCDELPITQYFESAAQAGLLRGRSFQEPPASAAADAFKISAQSVRPTYQHNHRQRRRCRPNDDQPRKVRRSGVVEREYVQSGKEQQRKQLQGRVVVAQNIVVAAGPSPRKPRAPKAVDEDLYKIPPEFLYEKPRRKKVLRNLWSGCLGLNCVA